MMKNLALLFLLAFIVSVSLHAQDKNQLEALSLCGRYQPDVMILGVFHFANPGLDVFKSKDFDMLTEQNQKEIDILLDKIEKFEPTKIMVEAERTEAIDSIINTRYRQYVSDSFDISDKSNEIYQLAFKLGKRLKHNKIYCSDSQVEWCGTSDIDWDTFDDDAENAYLTSKNQLQKVSRYNYNSFYEYEDSLKTVLPLVSYFEILNRPTVLKKHHQVYLTNWSLGGAGDNYYGADSVSRWYRRNLRIFSNIYDLVSFDAPERVLVIYGVGHAWLLSQFFKDSPDFNYIEVNNYLK